MTTAIEQQILNAIETLNQPKGVQELDLMNATGLNLETLRFWLNHLYQNQQITAKTIVSKRKEDAGTILSFGFIQKLPHR